MVAAMAEIYAHRGGAGAPLLLLHGVGHRWGAWAPVLPALEESFAVVACDSPGFGASPPLPADVPRTIPRYVDAFAAFLLEQGIDRPHVAGNSMGGAIALELARRGLVRSATAFSPAGFWGAPGLRWCQGSLGLVGAIPQPLRPALRRALQHPSGRRALLSELVKRPADVPAHEAIADVNALWDGPSLMQCLRGFADYRCVAAPAMPHGVPITVAWGDRDRLLPPWTQARRARRVVPAARHVRIDAGHLPYFDAPAQVVALIRETATCAA
jgi:pimeloyl-ACP methyl ester carboxylesterase